MEQTKKEPLITWKSFLISAVIILILYLFVSSFVDKKDKKQEAADSSSFFSSKQEYDYTVIEGNEDAENSILSIPVHGIILTEPSTDAGFFDFLSEEGAVYGYDIKDQLKRAAEDNRIKGVVLEINSPGGTIPGAIAISEGVKYYQETTGKPVYAHISDVGASGGYWAAASTEHISADRGSTIGSIGVIMGPFKQYNDIVSESDFLGGIDTTGGIENRYFTAGQFKDTGSPYRALSPEEERHWQTALDNEYREFVAFVSEKRNIAPNTIINTIKALPYEPQRALELKLIDEINNKENTYAKLAVLNNIEDFNIIQEESEFGFLSDLFKGAKAFAPQKSVKACSWCNGPLLLYDRSYMLGR